VGFIGEVGVFPLARMPAASWAREEPIERVRALQQLNAQVAGKGALMFSALLPPIFYTPSLPLTDHEARTPHLSPMRVMRSSRP
jgi:hypothetical protein